MASSLVLLIYSVDYDMMCFKGLLIPPPQPALAHSSLFFLIRQEVLVLQLLKVYSMCSVHLYLVFTLFWI